MGGWIFADDILLLSASRAGLQEMINICERFAKKKYLKFGTNPVPEKSKTKCIIFSKKKSVSEADIAPIILNGNPLPWVRDVKHLGNTLQCDNSMSTDCNMKRGKFIGKVNSLLQEFHYVSPHVMMKLINSHATSFFGSQLWDIQSPDCVQLYKA